MESKSTKKSGYGRYPTNGRELSMAEVGATKYNALELLYNRTGGSGKIQDHCNMDQLTTIETESGCEENPEYSCTSKQLHSSFRTIDGSCNNKQRYGLGAALTTFTRMLPAYYADGFNRPRGASRYESYHGYHLPSARSVSNVRLASQKSVLDYERNDFELFWGQFIDHDFDKTLASSSIQSYETGVLCNETCKYTAPCFPILIPKDDPTRSDRECVSFIRNSAACNTGKGNYARELINTLTSYLDASMVYGSVKEVGDKLWDQKSGEMFTGPSSPFSAEGKPLLPFIKDVKMDCMLKFPGSKCFAAGDTRANENIHLLTLHTIWVREHNRLVKELTNINPHWSGIRLYEEARKIVGAMIQKITFDEYLPKVLGRKGAETIGDYKGYDPDTSASITTEFSTAAFRFGHGTIGDSVAMLKNYDSKPKTIPLVEAFFDPQLITSKGIDVFIRGMVVHGNKMQDPIEPIDDSVRENLFRMPKARLGGDLAALNIQRGRDHGLAPYTFYVKKCGLGKIKSWQDLALLIKDREALDELKQLYGHPDNIDLFAGGMSERLVPGGRMGPTFRCIIADTMQKVRQGDRFWYENNQFSMDQLRELKEKVSPGRVFCDNGDNIRFTPKDVWRQPSETNPIVPCHEVPYLDLAPWRDEAGLTRNYDN